MRRLVIAVIALVSVAFPLQAKIAPLGLVSSQAVADSVSTSRFHGLSGTYPVLTPDELRELNQRRDDISKHLEKLSAEVERLSDVLDSIESADTVSVRKHMTLLGGLVRIPSLSPKEEQLLKQRRELENARKEAASHMMRSKETIAELTEEHQKAIDLMERHARFMERRILWGFIQWDVEKTE